MGACDNYIDPDIEDVPASVITYTVDWPARGLPPGLTIATSVFLPSGTTDYTILASSIIDGGLQTAFQLTGGIPGTVYAITNKVTLSDGEIMNATLLYSCVFQNTRRMSACL